MADPNPGNPADDAGQSLDTPPAGTGTPSNWLDGEDYVEFAAEDKKLLSKYKSPVEAIKGGVNAARLLGKKGQFNAEIPEDNDPKRSEKMAVVYDKLGRPKTPEEYQLKIPEIPKPLQGRVFYNENIDAAVRKIAHEEGVSQKALARLAEAVLGGQLQSEQAQFDARIAVAKQTQTELLTELGVDEYAEYFGTDERDADNVRTNTGLVGRLVMNVGGPELWAELEDTGLGNSPRLARLLVQMADAFVKEGRIDRPGAGGGTGGPAPKKQMTEYEYRKKMWPYSDPSLWGNPNDKTLHKE